LSDNRRENLETSLLVSLGRTVESLGKTKITVPREKIESVYDSVGRRRSASQHQMLAAASEQQVVFVP
jgi:hypothetical protein